MAKQRRHPRARRYLVLALVVGVMSLNTGGTFASFTAAATNDGTFDTGSLVLTDQVGSATACVSTGGGSTDANDNAACDALFNLTLQDGGSSNVKLTLTNDGSLDSSALQLHWAGGTTPCATVDEPTEGYHGTGDLCPKVRLYLEEYPSATAMSSNDRTSGYCWWGGSIGTTSCSFNNTHTVATFSSSFDGAGANVLDLGAFPAGASRWFRVYVNAQASALTNSMMGRRVDFGFTWQLLQ